MMNQRKISNTGDSRNRGHALSMQLALAPELIAACAYSTRAIARFDSRNRCAVNDGMWEVAA